ncbi:MAG TPA: V-type ATPase 116kDa subunit family protein [Pelolinea sp.]|nr:V-type ATPase 116kDa subunit family protein [Pelolinea sp.]
MILEMARIQIWGMKPVLERVIPVLHNFGGMQIDDAHDVQDVMVQPLTITEEMQSQHEEVDLLIANINGLVDLFSRFKKPGGEIETTSSDDFITIKSRVEELTAQIQYLNNRRKTLQDELISLSKYSEMLKVIAPVMPDSSKKSSNATLRALVHESQMRAMNLLSQQLKLLTHGKFEMISVKIGDATMAVIGIFPFEMMSQVETFMKNENVAQLMLPEEYSYLSTDEALAHLEKKIEINHQELDEIDNRFKRMADNWFSRLHTWQLVCRDRVDEFDAYTRIGETEYTFTIFGWVPVENLESLENVLKSNFGKKVTLNIIDIPDPLKERIPVAMRNPDSLAPFEDLVKIRAVPKYTDIDPSLLVAIFMPLFFGMMVGDVGYGVLMFLITILLLRKPKKGLLGDFLRALRVGAVWTVVFGVLYGEYFGNLGESLGIHPLWFSRSESSSITSLILMSMAVGASHILLGLLIGAWNAIVHRSRHEAWEKIGMFTGLVGIIFVAVSLVTKLPGGFSIFGWIVLAVGLITLALSMGKIGFFLGPIEFIGVIGNILSYLRIAALGLASVFLAKVANDMAGMVGSVIIGVVIAIIIHALNLVIGMLSPTIQSLRLQYVEFFRKFYEGGQSAFKPFCKRVTPQIITSISKS